MRSPGRPEPSRAVQREFWRLIATGITSAEAALTVGVSVPVGTRWFRHAGGMPPISLAEPSGRYLTFAEREEIALLKVQGKGVREIARTLGRDPATISRELRRNAATRGGKQDYRAVVAQWKAQHAAKRPKTAKLVENPLLRQYVQERLAGHVRRLDGTIVTGPRSQPWNGLNKPRRADRRWSTAWSPEQISHRLKIDFPDDESMRISHEAIYQSLFIEGRDVFCPFKGALLVVFPAVHVDLPAAAYGTGYYVRSIGPQNKVRRTTAYPFNHSDELCQLA